MRHFECAPLLHDRHVKAVAASSAANGVNAPRPLLPAFVLDMHRRQALDRGGVLERADKIATGHNADDIAETILLNIIRGDVPRCGIYVLLFAAPHWAAVPHLRGVFCG